VEGGVVFCKCAFSAYFPSSPARAHRAGGAVVRGTLIVRCYAECMRLTLALLFRRTP